ncbi:MAG TPA: two-component regulator propeller domain-containing protein [Opitutaceae bacterium]|nr:two-component regulator propeller domain-containing protein [Opitutaceae bacterium]
MSWFPAALRRNASAACFLLCLVCAGPVAAAPGVLAHLDQPEQYFFDTYNIESGLPGVAVNSVCQTRDGFLWVATGGGLARFDGDRFVSYRPTNTPEFRTPLVYRLCESRDGSLWIGTGRGLLRYRDGRFERMGLADAEIHQLAEDPAGRLWIGTFGAGLYVREQGALRHIDASVLNGSSYVVRLLVDHRGETWVATDAGGIFVSGHGSFHPFHPDRPLAGTVVAIAEAPAGTFWFGTRTNGLYRWRDGRLDHFGPEAGLAGDGVYDVKPANDGGVWIVSAKLQRLADPDHPSITTIPDAPEDRIYSVDQDREGSVWLSAKERGLLRGSAMPYRLITARDGLPDNVRSIARDATGHLWLAAQGYGVVRVSPGGRIDYPLGLAATGGPSPTVVLAARGGDIWVGTAGALHRWREGLERTFPQIRGVYGLFEDTSGKVWIGTAVDGMFRFAEGRFTPVQLDAGAPIQHATSFCEGPDGAVYAATWASGFARILGAHATLYDRSSGLPTDEVRAVYVDRKNRVWLGFRGHGLGLWEAGRCWSPEGLAQTLFDHVAALTEDAQGRFWLGTPAGVMWVAKSDLLAAARGTKTIAELRVAQVNRALRTASVWTGSQSVICRTAGDRLLFATREGILAVDPGRTPAGRLPPPVYIEHVSVDGRRVGAGRTLKLAAGPRNLVINYTAPSFIEPSQVRFKYRLDGYDADWVEANSRRSAAYGNLAPGDYRFHVIACNADGVWNDVGATVAIVQRPYFYQTGWFFGLLGLGLVGTGVGLYRWSNHRLNLRLERLEARQATERERRRIAKNLHDDLGANLTEIGLAAEGIQRKVGDPRLNEEMSALSERVRALAGTLDAIVWSANPANDSLDRLGTFVCGLFQDLCRVAGIRCRIDVPQPLPPLALSPDERSHLFLAAREAMTNAAKHAGAGEAWLRLRMEEAVLVLAIEDNGRGFDLAAALGGGRNGLGNIRSRVAELKGTVQFDTAPGRGTRIIMRVPIRPHPST